MKIKSYLPVFPGLYCTIFEPDEACVFEDCNFNGLSYDDYEWDYSEYFPGVAEDCCNFIERELPFDISVKFESTVSPKWYNYSNDSINCEYELSPETFREIIAYLVDNMEAFKDYIKEKYTSCSGFISHYSNDAGRWIAEYLQPNDENLVHCFGSVLNFICEVEEIDQGGMYEYCLEKGSLYNIGFELKPSEDES